MKKVRKKTTQRSHDLGRKLNTQLKKSGKKGILSHLYENKHVT